ncbi:Retrovirus-related Pol polyprotein from type-1 retrotransposable element R1 (Fragment) [Anthophora retusa]
MIVLNEPSETYTFDGMVGQSDIDVTLVSESCAGCQIEWEVKNDWSISDHNVIMIDMRMDVMDAQVEICKRWSCQGANWEKYMSELRECASACTYGVCEDVDLDQELRRLMSLIHVANRNTLKEVKISNVRRVKWWTNELRDMKKRVRKSGRMLQKARKRSSESVDEKKDRYKRLLSEYKRMLWKVKEDSWKNFVCASSNMDPWSPVYRVCRGRNIRETLSAVKVDGRMTATWKERVCVL